MYSQHHSGKRNMGGYYTDLKANWRVIVQLSTSSLRPFSSWLQIKRSGELVVLIAWVALKMTDFNAWRKQKWIKKTSSSLSPTLSWNHYFCTIWSFVGKSLEWFKCYTRHVFNTWMDLVDGINGRIHPVSYIHMYINWNTSLILCC